MPIHHLRKDQLADVVSSNKYEAQGKPEMPTSCFECEDEPLSALTLPGGSFGQLVILQATADAYGFTVDINKAKDLLVGKTSPQSKCYYLELVRQHSKKFDITPESLKELERLKILPDAKIEPDQTPIGALVFTKGPYTIKPLFDLSVDQKALKIRLLVVQQTLVSERHRLIAKQLIESGAVTLYNGLDEEYLYEVLSDMTDSHIFEFASHVALNAPIYELQFDDKGGYKMEDLGFVLSI